MRRKNAIRRTESAEKLAEKLVMALVMALRRHGVRPDRLREVLQQAASAATTSEAKRRRTTTPVLDSALLGTVLAVWHRDRRFLCAGGHPRPLKLTGRAASVEALARSCRLGRRPTEIVRELRSAGLIRLERSSGRYVPAGRSARMPTLNDFQIEHLAQGIHSLVQTVTYNYSRRGVDHRLFEQAASVRALPVRYRSAYRGFLGQQGAAFIAQVDDWLESRAHPPALKGSRRGRRKSCRTTPAGVYAFGYLG